MHRAPRSVCAGPHAVRVVPVMKGYADYAGYTEQALEPFRSCC